MVTEPAIEVPPVNTAISARTAFDPVMRKSSDSHKIDEYRLSC
ncbi:MAG: hypothetical protein PVI00_15425 [Desulfobacterales bacterium]